MTDNEKNTSIEYILAQGFVDPPTFWEHITKMHRVLGYKFIFWDFNYNLIFISATLLVMAFLLRLAPVLYYPYSVAVGFSPVLFLLIMLFSEINERACRLYELKQTCLYTSRHITALRCMYYSIVGAAFAIFVTTFTAENIAQLFRILPLCLAGLFVCASIGLSVIRFLNRWAIAVFAIVWVFVNLTLPISLGEDWELFLSGIPLVLTTAVAIAGAVVFIYQTNKMLTEENRYVIA